MQFYLLDICSSIWQSNSNNDSQPLITSSLGTSQFQNFNVNRFILVFLDVDTALDIDMWLHYLHTPFLRLLKFFYQTEINLSIITIIFDSSNQVTNLSHFLRQLCNRQRPSGAQSKALFELERHREWRLDSNLTKTVLIISPVQHLVNSYAD